MVLEVVGPIEVLVMIAFRKIICISKNIYILLNSSEIDLQGFV